MTQPSRIDFRQWWTLVKSAGSAWIDDYAPSMGAALAYYTVFSVAPLLLIVISVAGLVFGADAARGAIFTQLQGMMGDEGAKAVESLLASLNQPDKGILGTVVGFAVLLVGATTVFGELQDALDRIWRAPARDKTGGLWGLLRTRLLSFGMILGIGFLLMVSLVLSAVLSALGEWWGPMFGGWKTVAKVFDFVVSFGLITVVFAMIYKLMPRVQVRWHDVWIGAAVTSLLFAIGKSLIGLYIGKSGVASGYGAAGSLVVVLVWVYYSAQIFLMGAEFTWVFAHTFGSLKDQAVPAAEPGTTASAGGDKGTPDANGRTPDAAETPTPPSGAPDATAGQAKGNSTGRSPGRPPAGVSSTEATGWLGKPWSMLGAAVATGAALQALDAFSGRIDATRRADPAKENPAV